MKKIFTLTVITALTLAVYAQLPQKMSYQCVVRNASGTLVVNHAVGMKISILQGSATGTVVFSETYSPAPQSNGNGLVTVEIGSGTATVGTFAGIDWSAGPYFMKTETDPMGATAYTVVGTSQLLSVPYSLHSKTTESIPDNIVTSAKIADGGVATAGLANSSVTSAKIADATIATADLADGSVTTAKILDGTIVAADLANGAVTSAKLADGNITSTKLADGSVTSAKIADGTVTAIDIQDRERNISFPANALNYYPTQDNIISPTWGGLAWISNGNAEASLTIIKPLDWVETTNITIKLYFRTAGIATGIATFYIRPRAFNDGDDVSDAIGINPVSTVTIPGGSGWKNYSLTFIIPYNNLRTKNLWEFTMQRDVDKETHKQVVVLMAVELIYTANQ